ncbi:hypothetical protein Q8F55_008663 [Vanrija albida]|uniref:F-box domain-containing protein n=1 Tax=Vanrija albida TaxID=181172 RepID=A0ABR3PRF5_9TREE
MSPTPKAGASAYPTPPQSTHASPSPSHQPLPATALDHAAFPHLLDAVIAFAPPAALRALRATSRACHQAATRRLYAHLVVSGHTPLSSITLATPGTLGVTLGGVGWGPQQLEPAIKPHVGAYTRVLTLASQVDERILDSLALLFDRRPVVRVLEAAFGARLGMLAVSAPAIVMFAPLLELCHLPIPLALPRFTERMVLNISFGADAAARARKPATGWVMARLAEAHGVKELVVVFTRRAAPRRHASPLSAWASDSALRLGLLDHLIGSIAGQVQWTRCTFVGLAEVYPEIVGLPPDVPGKEVVAAVRRVVDGAIGDAVAESIALAAPQDSGLVPLDPVEMRGRVRYLTREEYRADVGAERYALEVDEEVGLL